MTRKLLEHDPKKWIPVLGKDHAQNSNLKRDDDSKKNYLALVGGIGAALAILFGGSAEAGSTRRQIAIHNIAMAPVPSNNCPGWGLNIFAKTEELSRVRETEMQIWIEAVTDPQYGRDFLRRNAW